MAAGAALRKWGWLLTAESVRCRELPRRGLQPFWHQGGTLMPACRV